MVPAILSNSRTSLALGRINVSRVPLVSPDTDNGIVATIFADADSRGFGVSSLYRALANSPELLKAWVEFGWPIRESARVSGRYREMLVLHVARHLRSEYVWAHHVGPAIEHGVSPEQIRALGDGVFGDHFDVEERAILTLGEDVARMQPISEKVWERLTHVFDPGQLVELVLVAALYSMVGRLVHGLGLVVEPSLSEVLEQYPFF